MTGETWLYPVFMIFAFLFIITIGIAITVFWIWMIINCAQRKFKNENDKIIWILVIVLAGIVGALIYYFVVKRKNER